MINIPPDVFLSTTLQTGIVYYYFHEGLRETQDSHYFVVLARRDTEVILVCATTQIEKRRRFATIRKLPISTLVEVQPSKANGLRCLSLFDCNNPFSETVSSLSRKHQTAPIRIKGMMDAAVVGLLITGVLDSPMVSEEVKGLLR